MAILRGIMPQRGSADINWGYAGWKGLLIRMTVVRYLHFSQADKTLEMTDCFLKEVGLVVWNDSSGATWFDCATMTRVGLP
jgi:hypothetical protein